MVVVQEMALDHRLKRLHCGSPRKNHLLFVTAGVKCWGQWAMKLEQHCCSKQNLGFDNRTADWSHCLRPDHKACFGFDSGYPRRTVLNTACDRL